MIVDTRTAPYAALVLRVSLGVMFLTHSLWLKGVVYTLPGTAAFFESIGLPGPLAYAVFAAAPQGSRMSLASDDPEHVIVVPGRHFAPTASAGSTAAVPGEEVEGDLA